MLYFCDRGITVVANGASDWANEAVTGYAVQQLTAASRPTIDAGRFGVGVDGLAADLDDRHMDALSAPQTAEFSLYLLVYRGATNGSHGLVQLGNRDLLLTDNRYLRFWNGSSAVRLTPNATFPLDARYLITVIRYGGNGFRVWKNGVEVTTGSPNDGAAVTMQRVLGTGAWPYWGSVGFFAFANVAHSDGTRAAIESYVLGRYTVD